MPRKPLRHRHLARLLPLTFSSFARSVARVASAYKVKRDKFGTGISVDKSVRSESSDDEEFKGVIQADFAFFDPKPDDFHGVKLFGFVDLILGQTTVGTVVKIEEDEDSTPYSVITALNLGRYKMAFGDQSRNVGLLVSQRVVNLPPDLLPPLYDALFDEVSWATEDEPTEELRRSFCFKYYLLVTRIYEHKNGGQKDGASGGSEEAIIYIKPEDEIFHQLSLWSFRFPLHCQQLPTSELKNYQLTGLVIALEADKVPIFRQQLRSLVIES
ncbi:hypothetical protein NMG60_11023669 [Bertholletia excelsa]